jgi:cytochrome c oxidase subunit 1
MAAGLVVLLSNLFVALFNGKKAAANPWGGVTLEWHTPSPPPLENFAEIPVIADRPYMFNPEAPQ